MQFYFCSAAGAKRSGANRHEGKKRLFSPTVTSENLEFSEVTACAGNSDGKTVPSLRFGGTWINARAEPAGHADGKNGVRPAYGNLGGAASGSGTSPVRFCTPATSCVHPVPPLFFIVFLF